MRVRGLGRVKQWLRRATAPFRSGVVVLLYHRVYEAPTDPQLLCVSPRRFAEHMEHLRQRYSVLSLRDLYRALAEGQLPRRGVVVTFDDGYADNLWNAKPILERYEVPATVFVTSGYVDSEREFWWDELERLLLHAGRLPMELRLTLNGSVYEWSLEETSEYSPSAFERYRGWHVEMRDDPTPRHRLYRELHRLLRPLPETERQRVLAELRRWAGKDEKARLDYRPLSSDELRSLVRGGLVGVGAHTVTHPVLSALPLAEQRRELEESKQFLEEVLGRPVLYFAYPYGSRADYTPQTVTLTRETGFEAACSNFGGVVRAKCDLYQLPRFPVRNWTGAEFARRLERWFSG